MKQELSVYYFLQEILMKFISDKKEMITNDTEIVNEILSKYVVVLTKYLEDEYKNDTDMKKSISQKVKDIKYVTKAVREVVSRKNVKSHFEILSEKLKYLFMKSENKKNIDIILEDIQNMVTTYHDTVLEELENELTEEQLEKITKSIHNLDKIVNSYLEKLQRNSEKILNPKEVEKFECNPYELNIGYAFICIILFLMLGIVMYRRK